MWSSSRARRPDRSTAFTDCYCSAFGAATSAGGRLACAVALSCAAIGYGAVRLARPARIALHLSGMGVGYIAMLTAFYVDNGPRLPVWRLLPPLWLWLLPAAFGVPIIVRAVLRLTRTRARDARTFDDLR